MIEQRIYIVTKMQGDGLTMETAFKPYFAGIDINTLVWNPIYDDNPKPEGVIVSITTTLENHAILEADENITRIDDL